MGWFGAQKFQGVMLDKHENEGGSFYSNWKAAGIGALVALVIISLLLSMFVVAEAAGMFPNKTE